MRFNLKRNSLFRFNRYLFVLYIILYICIGLEKILIKVQSITKVENYIYKHLKTQVFLS